MVLRPVDSQSQIAGIVQFLLFSRIGLFSTYEQKQYLIMNYRL